MTSLEDYLKQNFGIGSVHFNADSHVTPSGVVKFRMVSIKLGHHEEFECIVKNNVLQVIENDYVENKP
jgi:hypothetical protein